MEVNTKWERPPLTLIMYNLKDEEVGKLSEQPDGTLTFEGNVDESALVFFDMVIKENSKMLNELKSFIKENF